MSGTKRLVSGAMFAVLALPATAAATTTSRSSFQEEAASLSFSVMTPLVCELVHQVQYADLTTQQQTNLIIEH